jgi:hypothetical protein
MVSRQDRLVENQHRFRRANQRLQERVRDMAGAEQRVPFLCECADEACTAPVHLTLDEYKGVRDHRALFLIVPGHARVAGEDVISENERYAVVEKSTVRPAAR